MGPPKTVQNIGVLDPSLIRDVGIGCPALSSLSIPAISHFRKSSRQDPTATVIARSRELAACEKNGRLGYHPDLNPPPRHRSSSACGARRLGAALRFKPHHQITFAAKNLLNTNSRAVI
jgi:hypothetical protein